MYIRQVPISIKGKPYTVPANLTIMQALEYSGYRLERGVGCRGGLCGACATVYRVGGESRVKVALACQTLVEPNMDLVQLPFFPGHRASYRLEEIQATPDAVIEAYPEILKCMGCAACVKVCPQGLQPMEYIAATLKGDLAEAAELSSHCIMCGLCAARCPAGLVQYNIAELVRRLTGRYLFAESGHLKDRVAQLESGVFDAELDELVAAGKDRWKEMYDGRDIE